MNPTQFSWTGATEREDNSPYLPEQRRGYNVFIVPNNVVPSGSDLTFTAISSSNAFTMPISDLGSPLGEGDWDLYVSDVDIDGRESELSTPTTFSIVVARPKRPTGLIVS